MLGRSHQTDVDDGNNQMCWLLRGSTQRLGKQQTTGSPQVSFCLQQHSAGLFNCRTADSKDHTTTVSFSCLHTHKNNAALRALSL